MRSRWWIAGGVELRCRRSACEIQNGGEGSIISCGELSRSTGTRYNTTSNIKLWKKVPPANFGNQQIGRTGQKEQWRRERYR